MSGAMSEPPVLSIIIVNWRVRELLRECLASVQRTMRLRPCEFEVVVVDNASGDGSVEMLAREFPWVHAIANDQNAGFAAANNQALPRCRGEFLMLLNPDTVVTSGAVDAMLARMRADPRLAVLGCRLLNADGTLQKWTGGSFPTIGNLIGHYYFLDRLLPRSLRPRALYLDRDVAGDIDVDWVSGACMMLRRKDFPQTIFDAAFFMYAEDMELCHRMRSAGRLVRYTGAASIVHYQGASMQQQVGEIMLSSIKGPRLFYSRLHGESRVWMFDLVTLSGFALRWLAYSLSARFRPGGAAPERATSSRRHMQIAWQLMRRTRAPAATGGTSGMA